MTYQFVVSMALLIFIGGLFVGSWITLLAEASIEKRKRELREQLTRLDEGGEEK